MEAPATVEQLATIAKFAVILDVRGREEIATLGNAINGSVNTAYSDDDLDSFLQRVQELLPDKETPVICH